MDTEYKTASSHTAEPQQHIIDLPSGKIAYEVSGPEDGMPVIIMHGWGCSSFTVRSIAKTASTCCRVYNLDLPGFGNSPEPTEVWGVGEYAAAIAEFIAKLKISNPVLVGHSYGGRIAIWLASERKDIKALVLVDAAGIKPRRSYKYYLKVYSFKAAKAFYRFVLGKEKAEKRIERMRAAKGSADYANSSPRMRAVMSKSVNQDLTPMLNQIVAPSLLIWGEDDTATPMRDARIMEKLIPDAGLVSFPGCGHYSFLDNPGQFSAVLLSFLKSLKK